MAESDKSPALTPRCPSCTSFDTKPEAHSPINRCVECGSRFVLLAEDCEVIPPPGDPLGPLPGTQEDMARARNQVAYCSSAPGFDEHERQHLGCWNCIASLLRTERERMLKNIDQGLQSAAEKQKGQFRQGMLGAASLVEGIVR